MKLGLVFTNDWELFGDGTGNFYELQFKPLYDWLEIFSRYNAKFTLMAEILQQLEHIKWSDDSDHLKRIVSDWERAVTDAKKAGHDIQLHLHPQWIDAKYDGSLWHLNMELWPIAKLSETEIENLIIRSKSYLEDVIANSAQEHRIIAFRAGAYCIEPSDKLITAFANTGIKCDCSITKGLVVDEFYDFSDAYSNIFPWNTSENSLKHQGSSPIVEMPIYSLGGIDFPAIRKFFPKLYYFIKHNTLVTTKEINWINERDKVKEQRYPRKRRFYKQKEKKNLNWYYKAALSKTPVQLDYDYLPATIFVDILSKIWHSKELRNFVGKDIIIPILASGHMKDMHNSENILNILELIDKNLKDKIIYLNLSEAIQYYDSDLRSVLYD